MFSVVRRYAPTFGIAFVTAMVAGGGFVWAHNNPSAGHVTYAHKAGKANKVKGTAVLPLKKVSSSAEASGPSSQAAARAAADKVVLFKKAPFTVYMKCFTDETQVDNPYLLGEIFVQTSKGKTLFSSADEDDSSNGYLVSSTPETERQLLTVASAAGSGNPGVLNISDAEEGAFYAVSGNTQIEGDLFLATKVGNPEVGDGPFGSDDRRCMGRATIHYR